MPTRQRASRLLVKVSFSSTGAGGSRRGEAGGARQTEQLMQTPLDEPRASCFVSGTRDFPEFAVE